MAPDKTTALIIVCALLLGSLPAAADQDDQKDGSPETADAPDSLANLAVKHNPSIAAMEARVRALEHRTRKAGAWLDPTVAVEYANVPVDSFALGDHAMSGVQFKLQQTFFFPGKVHLRQAVAQGKVRQQKLQLEERKLQLRAAVKRAYVQLALVRQLRTVTRDHIKLLAQFVDTVRVKYEVGKVGQHDLLRRV